MKIISATTARKQFFNLIRKAEDVIITKFGEGKVIMIDFEKYKKLKKLLKDNSNAKK
jgi:prevent-host-death family protein